MRHQQFLRKFQSICKLISIFQVQENNIHCFPDDANANPTSEAASETAPETAPETVPEAAPETAPRAAPEAAPETAPASVPETDYSAAGITARKAAFIAALKKNLPDLKLTPDDLVVVEPF